MAGLFRKFASAFVTFEGKEGEEPALEPDIATDEVLKQAETVDRTPPPVATPAAEEAVAPTLDAPSGADPLQVVQLAPEAVWAGDGLTEGPNSAARVLKMLAGLAQFPPPQQLAMVRALDAADDTWTEDGVLADARARQGSLRKHLQRVEVTRAEVLKGLEEETRAAQRLRQEMLQRIDEQMAELTRLREDAVAESARSLAALEQRKQEAELAADSARRATSAVVDQLGALVSFFSAAGPPPSFAAAQPLPRGAPTRPLGAEGTPHPPHPSPATREGS